MKALSASLLALLLAGCGGGSEADAARDRAAAAATWAALLQVDGADVRIPLEEMSVLLIKDEEAAEPRPVVFEIRGQGISLLGEIPPANQPGYGEDWKKMVGATLAIRPSGEFAREAVESRIALPGKPEVAVTGGTLTVEGFTGKWAGSSGDRTLKGRIRLQLRDGRTLEGTYAVHAVTWG